MRDDFLSRDEAAACQTVRRAVEGDAARALQLMVAARSMRVSAMAQGGDMP